MKRGNLTKPYPTPEVPPLCLFSPLLAGLFAIALGAAQAEEPAKADYQVESIKLPEDAGREIGALVFQKEGELVVATRRTGIIAGTPSEDPKGFVWRHLCRDYFQDVGGLTIEENGDVLVAQTAELTRLSSSGKTDEFDRQSAVSTFWGLSGQTSETVTGPLPDDEGNWFLAMNLSAPNATPFSVTRGPFMPPLSQDQRYAAVPWRGWIVKAQPTGDILPFANGFGEVWGLLRNDEGELFATDNRGDWKPAAALYHVVEGGFYGQPSSQIWKKEEGQEAEILPRSPAVWLPPSLAGDRVGQPVYFPAGEAFGPYEGQLLVGSLDKARLLRVMPEKIGDTWQGAATTFLKGSGLGAGNYRLCFSPDGQALYVGKNQPGPGPAAQGLKRVVPAGEGLPFAVREMNLTDGGFELNFTRPVDRKAASELSNYRIRLSPYAYHAPGEPDQSSQFSWEIAPSNLVVEPGGLVVAIQISDFLAGYVYRIDLAGVVAEDGAPLSHDAVCYTLNTLLPTEE